MPTTINASNTSGGAVVTGDGSGVLELQSGGVTALTANGANVTVAGTLTATGGIPAVTTALTSPVSVIGNATAGSEIRLPEDTDNGSNYVALKASNSIASNVTFTLPAADGSSGQFLQTNGTGTLAFATPSGVASSYTEFLSSGTWTKPAGVTWVFIEAIGGGGGGAGAAFGGQATGGGGGGGYASRLMLASSLGSTETVTIGAGGTGGVGDDGANGGNTTFGSHVTGPFGLGALRNASVVKALAGTGNSGFYVTVTTDNQQTYYYSTAGLGGVGASSVTGRGGNTLYGGAGGGGCVSGTSPGASAGVSQFGGNGGAGNHAGNGGAGVQPGGGGGGGASSFVGGAGGAGRVRVWAW